MITSATLDYALDMRSNPYYFITKHLVYLSMGIILAAIISKIKLSFIMIMENTFYYYLLLFHL